MLPGVKQVIQLIKWNAKKEFLVCYRQTEGVRAGLSFNYFRDDMQKQVKETDPSLRSG